MVPPTTLVCALMAKRPKPPPGSGLCPVQTSADRSEAASAASVPSILSVGLTLIEPSNAAFIGAPATRSFSPVRLPSRAAGKSAKVTLASTGSSRQTKWPVAPKLFEIDGQASEKSTLFSVSTVLVAWLRRIIVPLSMRISEKAATVRTSLGFLLRASASISTDQLDFPSASMSTAMVGRSSETSATSTRPISSGKTAAAR